MKKLIPLVAVILVGCGSDKTDEDKYVKPPLNLTTPIESLEISEESVKTFTFPVEGVGADSPVIESSFDGYAFASAEYEDGVVTVSIQSFPISREMEGELGLKLTSEDEVAVLNIPVFIRNTSAEEYLNTIASYQGDVERIFQFSEEKSVFKAFLSRGEKDGDLNEDEMRVLNKTFATLMGTLDSSGCFFCNEDGLVKTLREYHEGVITEAELRSIALSLHDRIYTQLQLLRQIINDVALVTELDDTGSTSLYRDKNGKHSQFYGHEFLGRFDGDQFIFKEKFKVLEHAISTNPSAVEVLPKMLSDEKRDLVIEGDISPKNDVIEKTQE